MQLILELCSNILLWIFFLSEEGLVLPITILILSRYAFWKVVQQLNPKVEQRQNQIWYWKSLSLIILRSHRCHPKMEWGNLPQDSKKLRSLWSLQSKVLRMCVPNAYWMIQSTISYWRVSRKGCWRHLCPNSIASGLCYSHTKDAACLYDGITLERHWKSSLTHLQVSIQYIINIMRHNNPSQL